jgi:hypothetical protein
MNSELETMWKSEAMIYIGVIKHTFVRGLMQVMKVCSITDLRTDSLNWDFPNRNQE